MSALEPPPALVLVKAPFSERGHGRPSLRRTPFVTAQAHNPISAIIRTEFPAFGNSDKENP